MAGLVPARRLRRGAHGTTALPAETGIEQITRTRIRPTNNGCKEPRSGTDQPVQTEKAAKVTGPPGWSPTLKPRKAVTDPFTGGGFRDFEATFNLRPGQGRRITRPSEMGFSYGQKHGVGYSVRWPNSRLLTDRRYAPKYAPQYSGPQTTPPPPARNNGPHLTPEARRCPLPAPPANPPPPLPQRPQRPPRPPMPPP